MFGVNRFPLIIIVPDVIIQASTATYLSKKQINQNGPASEDVKPFTSQAAFLEFRYGSVG